MLGFESWRYVPWESEGQAERVSGVDCCVREGLAGRCHLCGALHEGSRQVTQAAYGSGGPGDGSECKAR